MQLKHSCGATVTVPNERAGQRSLCPVCGRAFDIPPVDLNKPVENPALVSAIARHADEANPRSLRALLEAVLAATFLAGMLDGTEGEAAADEASFAPLPKGSRIAILAVRDKEDRHLLALFSDWSGLRAWDGRFSGLVMPASQALNFVIKNGYDGLVINPGGPSIQLDRKHVHALLKGELPPA